ncbi:MAG: glycosyltransferase family 2 protein [Planctomycetota bacterium]|nr:MAG: glycosyltransferase family 2 protein [Planctomycetota bacterium]
MTFVQVEPPPAVDSSTRREPPGPVQVTVVMPVRNEQQHIARTLQQVLDQRHDGFDVEVLVVDGRSTDRTREIVRCVASQRPEVRLLDNPHRLSSAARNTAVRHGRGEYFVIIDGHCEIPSQTYLSDLVNAFEVTGADCIGRPQPLDVTGATPFQAAVAAARSSWLGHHPDSFIYTHELQTVPAASVAVAYRRRVFERIGLFDERFDACEDCEFNHRVDRAGMRCVLDPRLAVKYQPRGSLRGLFKQMARYGRGRLRLARKHPASASWKSFLPAVFVLGVVAGPAFCLLAPAFWLAYFAAAGGYVAVLLAASASIGWRRRQLRLAAWLPLVFLTIHFGAGVGVLSELAIALFNRTPPPRPDETSLDRAAAPQELADFSLASRLADDVTQLDDNARRPGSARPELRRERLG